MDWIFVGIMIGSIAYLALIVLAFLENYKVAKERIEQTKATINRLDTQLKESEHARMEAEERSSKIEEEALLYEQQVSELQQKIRLATPRPASDGEGG